MCIITELHPFSAPPQPPAAACAAEPPRPCAAASGGTPRVSWPARPLPSAHPAKPKGMGVLNNSGQNVQLDITSLLRIPGKFGGKLLLLENFTFECKSKFLVAQEQIKRQFYCSLKSVRRKKGAYLTLTCF